MSKHRYQIRPAWLVPVFCVLLSSSAVLARDGGRDASRDNPAGRVADQGARASDNSRRSEIRVQEERAKIEARAAQDRAKAETRSPAERAKIEARLAEDQAKLNQDAAENALKREEEARKDAADLAEDQAKAAENAAEQSNSSSGHGSGGEAGANSSMKMLASSENPEFDRQGFPARRGEIVALDLTREALAQAKARGFKLVTETSLRSLGTIITRMRVPSGMTAEGALNVMRAIDKTGSFDFAHYYGLNIGVSGGQEATAQSSLPRQPGSLKIGMIDTAITAHPALSGTTIQSRDFSAGTGTAPTQHGTAIASILASEGSSHIRAANVFKNSGGQAFTSSDAIVRALEWLVDDGVPVINISLAGPRNAILDTLIQRAAAKGFVIVAAAGNGGPNAPPAYPAAVPGVVAVTAVDSANQIYRYANQGNYIGVAARGVHVPAAAPDGKIAGFTGTSFATPHVAVVIARCIQQQRKNKPNMCVFAMHLAAKDLGTPGRDPVYGFGLVN
jgi:subtilisin family serine protease